VVVEAGAQRFAVPRSAIDEIVSTRSAAIRVDRLGPTALATIRGRRMALVDLPELLGMAGERALPPMLAIVDVPGGSYAIGVDAVLDTEELVVKPAAPAVMAAGVYAGQTLPDSGLPLLLLDCAGMAAVAGLSFERSEAPLDEPVAAVAPGVPVFVFDDLDGRRRVIALAAIDRVERIPVTAISDAGGALRLVNGGRTVPLVATGPLPTVGDLPVLRLHDDRCEIGYAIREAIDIVDLDAPVSPAAQPGAVLGVAVLGGDVVEMLDPLWILGQAVRPAPGRRTIAFAGGAAVAWMTTFLAPALEAAGYRLLADPVAADLALVMEGEPAPPAAAAPVVTLSREPGHGGVYCYDRAALIDAVARRLEACA
jgi:two-component system chemotaxis sensor kinase CheA